MKMKGISLISNGKPEGYRVETAVAENKKNCFGGF